jgi:hypothetical protein
VGEASAKTIVTGGPPSQPALRLEVPVAYPCPPVLLTFERGVQT